MPSLGSFLGSKATTLELAGMLFPEILAGPHVVIGVENMGDGGCLAGIMATARRTTWHLFSSDA